MRNVSAMRRFSDRERKQEVERDGSGAGRSAEGGVAAHVEASDQPDFTHVPGSAIRRDNTRGAAGGPAAKSWLLQQAACASPRGGAHSRQWHTPLMAAADHND